MFVSKDDLNNACKEQFDLFVELFPDGVEVTEAVCVEHAQVFDWTWASENLLTDAQREVYDEAVAQAWKVYDEVVAQAWKVYDEVVAPARKVYDEVVAPAGKVYDKTVAVAFYRATLI